MSVSNTNPEIGVRLTDVAKHFGGVGAANAVSFSLATGHLLALLGPSGCGKTTTLRLIAGFESVDAGTIEIGGQPVAGPGLHRPPEKRRVGMVFQEYALFPHVNVWQNISFGLGKLGAEARRSRVGDVLALVGLTGLGERMPHELSGGQQQRVALARALAPQPDLILHAGLRVRVRAEVRAILKQAGATAIFVTHDQEEALSLVDEVAVMLAGRVHQLASPQKLYRQPISREVATFIGDANFVPGFGYGRHIESLLGNLESQVPVEGPVDVLIRPENVEISPAPSEINAHRVRQQLFFGHDQLVSVQLSSGETIDVRLGPAYTFAVNQPVTVRVRGPVMAYRINETQRVG
ncbi:MAG TPA: ABC transporter ATP-binding protein [Caldilineaceae bacterium]|nr:ABC transporter ATP-binding protein [Caldilineaceae bacterium]